jgi:hypothetical protein
VLLRFVVPVILVAVLFSAAGPTWQALKTLFGIG